MYSVSSATDSDLNSIYRLVSNKLSTTDSSTSTATSTDSTTSSGGDSISLSGSATVLSKLQALKSQDSEKFNSALSEITSKLRKAAASQVRNPSVGLELSKLADKCDTLAKETKLTDPDSTTSSTSGTSSTTSKYAGNTTSLADLLNSTYSSSTSSYYNTYSTSSNTSASPLSQLITSLFGD